MSEYTRTTEDVRDTCIRNYRTDVARIEFDLLLQ